jgi:hypothetical protein
VHDESSSGVLIGSAGSTKKGVERTGIDRAGAVRGGVGSVQAKGADTKTEHLQFQNPAERTAVAF